MSETSRFKQMLIRIASSGTGQTGWRKSRPPRGGSLLAAFLLEIDNTVLPRLLHFRDAHGAILTCAAANRRLITVETVDGSTISVTSDDENGIAALHTRLQQFLSGQEEILVKAEQISRDVLPGAAGISAGKLSSLWKETFSAELPETPAAVVSAFLDQHQNSISAWCRNDNGRVDTGGAPEAFENVQALHAEMEKTLVEADGPTRTLAPNGFFLILDDGSGTGGARAFATLGSLTLALLAEDADMAALSADWQDACSASI